MTLLFSCALAAAAQAATLSSPPGAFDSAATGAGLCRPGYAHAHRSVSYSVRDRVYDRYGLPRGSRRGYVIDHFIPLELGGLNVAANLWPQTRFDAHRKDLDENRLRYAVCSGAQTLPAARAEMVRLWARRG